MTLKELAKKEKVRRIDETQTGNVACNAVMHLLCKRKERRKKEKKERKKKKERRKKERKRKKEKEREHVAVARIG